MNAIVRTCLVPLALLTAVPAIHAEDCYRHYDRAYVGLYKNPHRHWDYRHVYAGHYVRKDRPYRWETIYERTTYPRNYFNYGRYRWPDNPKPQTTRSLVRPAGFNPYPGTAEYYYVPAH